MGADGEGPDGHFRGPSSLQCLDKEGSLEMREASFWGAAGGGVVSRCGCQRLSLGRQRGISFSGLGLRESSESLKWEGDRKRMKY